MKKIVINDGEELVQKHSCKARIVNVIKNKILVAKYANLYMLPGGKIDEYETPTEALKREIYEETGFILDDKDIKPLIKTDVFESNYQSRDCTEPIHKNNETYYYQTDKYIEISNQHLSEKEIDANFELIRMDIYELIEILSKKMNTPKERAYSKELLSVLKIYLEENKYIDLHTHTTASDGEYRTREVIEKAKNNNIGILAITDHDTVQGLTDDLFEEDLGIKVIPGVELTVKVSKGRMHILGLNIDYHNEKLIEYLKNTKRHNIENLKRIIDYLKSNGIHFNESDIDNILNKHTNVGRPDVAKLLIKYNYVSSVQEAFDKYLIEAFNMTRKKNTGNTIEGAIKAITYANGIPILAHPSSLELNRCEFEELLIDMIKYGLRGLEVYHPNVSEEDRLFYMDMVTKYKLLYSGGSDYHGEHVKPDIELGYGRDNLYIKNASILRELKK